MNIKRAMLSAIIVWTSGVSAFVGSYLINWMENPELQANLVLTIALIPSAILGAFLFYKKRENTNGFKLGISMFIVSMILDAALTVPLLVIPAGGSHLSFFTDPGFWLIAVEYILVVGLYWRLKVYPAMRVEVN